MGNLRPGSPAPSCLSAATPSHWLLLYPFRARLWDERYIAFPRAPRIPASDEDLQTDPQSDVFCSVLVCFKCLQFCSIVFDQWHSICELTTWQVEACGGAQAFAGRLDRSQEGVQGVVELRVLQGVVPQRPEQLTLSMLRSSWVAWKKYSVQTLPVLFWLPAATAISHNVKMIVWPLSRSEIKPLSAIPWVKYSPGQHAEHWTGVKSPK